ncbi:MAG: tetratricopeptide repeat protein [Akkermansiaceae bacterium]|nr:tetratricopeptide repeat protein [Armatimonadota bacterium]
MASIGMNGSSPGENFYTILGVAENATADEIKHAYYRLVRQVRPESDPEAYHRFQKAGSVLADPHRRREYDQLREAGRRVEVLSDQAVAAAERDPQKAFGLLKAAIALAPDAPRPRILLAHVLTRLNDYAGAERQYRRLLEERPRDETLHYRFARCLFVQGRYDDAEQVIGAAIRLNPHYHDAHMLLARLYEKSGQFGAAIFALEKAIANDDSEDYADFDALLRLLVLHLRMDNGTEAERTARRLMAVLPPPGDDDPTAQCERAAKRMLLRAKELAGEEQIKAVRAVAALGGRLPNITPEIVEAFAQVSRESRLFLEAKHAQEDELLPDALKQMAEGLYLNRALPEPERQERRRNVAASLNAAVLRDATQVQSLLEYLRREYPVFSADQDTLLSDISKSVQRRLPASTDTLPGGSGESASGGGVSNAPRGKGFIGWFKSKK